MRLKIIAKYDDFFKRTKDEPIVILQGSKRSGKTYSILQNIGVDFFSAKGKRFQCFSESPKQQNFGLMSDFQNIFNPILSCAKSNATQKTFNYQKNELAFINIINNVHANNIVNSLGACDDRFVNEVHAWDKSVIEKLMINNRRQMFFDYNPYREFWIRDFITEDNFLKTIWRDNPFLSKSQTDLFLKWTEAGQKAEVGSYDHWRWQVLCEGIYADITGEIFTTDNIHFCTKAGERLRHFIIFADPSNARGGDYFALTLTAIGEDGNLYLIDSFSCNRIEKVLIAEQIKKWQRDYPVEHTFIETNGEYGQKFFKDCYLSKIPVDTWHSRKDKFERIMMNFDIITNKTFIVDTINNREFVKQIYTFRHPDTKDKDGRKKTDEIYDDNIDCLNNAIMAYILVYKELKILF